VVSGPAWRDERIPPEAGGLHDLVLSEEIRRRLATEVVGFFSPGAAALYGKVGVPYRRGVLMYGPPGNGKTSIIRSLAGMLPDVAGLVLRSGRGIDEDDFTAVVKRWVESAPAILVIEDLNWMIPERVSVAAFLNQLDGLATPRGAAGLLMIASTNHPETLDPAINDRPGRFDVMLEVPSPDAALRREFFRRATEALGDVPDEPVLSKLVTATSGLSFAHLREVVQAAGLAAVRDGRDRRSEADLLDAAAAVGRAHHAADRGFPARPDEAFGLGQFRTRREH
jgi:SpoVK/Ycf46/Vps4 family AAA+-type ATPase